MYADPMVISSQPSDEFYLARQPILGRDQQPVAFELLFRAPPEYRDTQPVADMAATAAVISGASQLGLKQVVGEQAAFVNVDDTVLMSDFVQFLPHEKVILEILETVRPTPQIVDRIAELKSLGFRFALDDVTDYSDLVRACLDLVDVVKIDLRAISQDQLPRLADDLGGAHPALLAEKVETADEFERCLELGFDYFQGYYFAPPTILSGKKIDPPALVLLRLLNLVRAHAPCDAIVHAVAHDAALAGNVLRLVNSDAAGLDDAPAASVPEALQLLGRHQLQRWLEILLAAVPASMSYAAMTSPRCAATCASLPQRCAFPAGPHSPAGASARLPVNWA